MARKQSGITQQPYLNHDIKTQGQQVRFLDSTPEGTKNLGHDGYTVDRLIENPARITNYDSADTSRVINEPRSQGVYGRFRDPKGGTSTSENLSRWSDYARSNSYTGHGDKAGHGKEPSMPDPRERAATGYRPASGKDSDGYLADPKEWSRFEFGSESGQGRLEKIGKR